MVQQQKQEYYIHIQDPVQFRRSLLEAVKAMVEVLQSIELLSKTRKEKAEAIARLRILEKEISSLFAKLKSYLPKTDKALDSEVSQMLGKSVRASVDEGSPVPAKDKKPEVIEDSSVSRLDKELKEIEQELEKLG